MADTLQTPKITRSGSMKGGFKLDNWKEQHELYAAFKTGCTLKYAKPEVCIRFYLKKSLSEVEESVVSSKPKLNYLGHPIPNTNSEGLVKKRKTWYSLHADVLDAPTDFVFRVSTEIKDKLYQDKKSGILSHSKAKDVEVVKELILMTTHGYFDEYNEKVQPAMNGWAASAESIQVFIEVELFHPEKPDGSTGCDSDDKATEEQESFRDDFKGMYTSEESYSDLTIETKGFIVLSAHKFVVAARSYYLRAKLEEATKKNDFNGVLKVPEVTGKAMKVVLHWMYTDELHETAANVIVMEEVANAAILFGLNQLIKILDKKLITICTKLNMFQLYTVARDTAMPTASADIAAFIKENV